MRVARGDQNPREVSGRAQARKIPRKDIELGCKGKRAQGLLGTEKGLSRGAFPGFLSGNRRGRRRLPKWEGGPDLEWPGRRRLACGSDGEQDSAEASQRT
jgi:hypothetical protein